MLVTQFHLNRNAPQIKMVKQTVTSLPHQSLIHLDPFNQIVKSGQWIRLFWSMKCLVETNRKETHVFISTSSIDTPLTIIRPNTSPYHWPKPFSPRATVYAGYYSNPVVTYPSQFIQGPGQQLISRIRCAGKPTGGSSPRGGLLYRTLVVRSSPLTHLWSLSHHLLTGCCFSP